MLLSAKKKILVRSIGIGGRFDSLDQEALLPLICLHLRRGVYPAQKGVVQKGESQPQYRTSLYLVKLS